MTSMPVRGDKAHAAKNEFLSVLRENRPTALPEEDLTALMTEIHKLTTRMDALVGNVKAVANFVVDNVLDSKTRTEVFTTFMAHVVVDLVFPQPNALLPLSNDPTRNPSRWMAVNIIYVFHHILYTIPCKFGRNHKYNDAIEIMKPGIKRITHAITLNVEYDDDPKLWEVLIKETFRNWAKTECINPEFAGELRDVVQTNMKSKRDCYPEWNGDPLRPYYEQPLSVWAQYLEESGNTTGPIPEEGLRARRIGPNVPIPKHISDAVDELLDDPTGEKLEWELETHGQAAGLEVSRNELGLVAVKNEKNGTWTPLNDYYGMPLDFKHHADKYHEDLKRIHGNEEPKLPFMKEPFGRSSERNRRKAKVVPPKPDMASELLKDFEISREFLENPRGIPPQH